ncbi:hypothetical protein O6H91_08G114800 [Diphasiastrum complanatum]|uniref:Uncharacterized protein n=1 Tax=Diphasiastrum complanatum TaxID=34168 RepID=A0ACC2D156_DIPCM|nr:hypothetical protein O6H91_08G114800 [Diphasiastrum complanatum]
MAATRIHIICCRWIKPTFPLTGSGNCSAQVMNRKQSPWSGGVSSFHCLQADKIAPTVGPASILPYNAVCEQVRGLYKQGKLEKALEVLQLPNKEYISAVSAAYVHLLQQCVVMQSLPDGRRIHAHIVDSGLESNVHVANTLLGMYLKCGGLEIAREFFDRMLMRDVISWNLIMQGYAKSGCGEEALRLWKLMRQEGLKPSRDMLDMEGAKRH